MPCFPCSVCQFMVTAEFATPHHLQRLEVLSGSYVVRQLVTFQLSLSLIIKIAHKPSIRLSQQGKRNTDIKSSRKAYTGKSLTLLRKPFSAKPRICPGSQKGRGARFRIQQTAEISGSTSDSSPRAPLSYHVPGTQQLLQKYN